MSRRPRKRLSPHRRARPTVVAWEWDADADRIIASASLREVYGVAAIERVSHGFTLVHPDDYEGHQALVHAAVDRGRGYRSSFRIIRPDTGRVVRIEECAEVIGRGAAAPPLLIGVAFDAGVRYDRRAALAGVQALDALVGFGDALLCTYAAILRRTSPPQKRMSGGQWVQQAERAFAERPSA